MENIVEKPFLLDIGKRFYLGKDTFHNLIVFKEIFRDSVSILYEHCLKIFILIFSKKRKKLFYKIFCPNCLLAVQVATRSLFPSQIWTHSYLKRFFLTSSSSVFKGFQRALRAIFS